jgi:predicted permease
LRNAGQLLHFANQTLRGALQTLRSVPQSLRNESQTLRRLTYLLRGKANRQALNDEIAFHQEMTARAGRPAKTFGNPTRIHEQAREAWGWTWLDRLWQDLTYASRMLARSPGFTISAILILALGLGANIFIFSTTDWIFFKPLPVRDPESLVRLMRRSPQAYSDGLPYPTAIDYRDHSKTLSAVMTLMNRNTELGPEAKTLSTNYISPNYFKELGASAAYGRLLDPTLDEARSNSPAVVLGHEFWRHYYNSDPGVVGKSILLNHQPATIVGVEPYGFPGLGDSGDSADLWIAITQEPYFVAGSTALTDQENSNATVWARLAPGATSAAAEQELLSLTNARRKLFPGSVWKDEIIQTEPAGHSEVLDARRLRAVSIVAALAILILIMTCANLGGLLLARGVSRQHEVGIRIAIGANRKRIFRQLFTESLLLAFLGSAAGLALACATLKACLLYWGRPTWVSATPDWRVCALLLGMTLVAAVFFGFLPALQLARQQQKRTVARQILIALQVAASCMLVILSSLLVRGAQHFIYTTPGFGYEQVTSIDPQLGEHGYKPEAARSYLAALKARLNAMPRVHSVALVKYGPLTPGWRIDSELKGQQIQVYQNSVDADFFRTMDIPLLLGRSFQPGDQKAVILSQALAQTIWPDENPLGKIYLDKSIVVGIIGSNSIYAARDPKAFEVFSPLREENMNGLSIVVKSADDPDNLVPTLKSTVQSLDSRLFPQISPLKSTLRYETQSAAELALLMSLIGVASIMLAALGILGLVAYTVSQRTKEIAIRLALGSPRMQVMISVVDQFVWPVAAGVLVGVSASAASSQIIRRALYGVSALDPLSYSAAIALLLGVFVIAAILPARRALRLDIAQALHQD